MGVAIKPAPNGLGPLNTAKSFTHSVDIFDQLLALSCNHVFKIISPHPPPLSFGAFSRGRFALSRWSTGCKPYN